MPLPVTTEDTIRIDILTAIPRPDERTVAEEGRIVPFVNGSKKAPLAASPSHPEDLILGWALSEGYLAGAGDLRELIPSDDGTEVRLKTRSRRKTPRQAAEIAPIPEYRWQPRWLHTLALEEWTAPQNLQRCLLLRQDEILYRTCDLTAAGAIDRALGLALKQGTDLADTVIFTDGLLTEALVKKAIFSAVPVLAGTGLSTDRAVALARAHHINLIGNVRTDGLDIFSGRGIW